MKFPRLLCSVTLLLLMQLTAVEEQVLTVPKLNSTLGNTATITTCDAGTVTFTATGDSGPTALDVEFRIDRGGTIIYASLYWGKLPDFLLRFSLMLTSRKSSCQ